MTQIVLDSKSPQHRHRGSATAFVVIVLLLVFAMLRLTYTPEVPDAQLHRLKHYDEFALLKTNLRAFHHKVFRVSGICTESNFVLGYGLYRLTDASGNSISVITKQMPPAKGMRIDQRVVYLEVVSLFDSNAFYLIKEIPNTSDTAVNYSAEEPF